MTSKNLPATREVSVWAQSNRLFGPPTLHPSENVKQYRQMFDGFVDLLLPENVLELSLVRDIVDLGFEIARMRRLKPHTLKCTGRPPHKTEDEWLASTLCVRIKEQTQIEDLIAGMKTRRNRAVMTLTQLRKMRAETAVKTAPVIDGEFKEVTSNSGDAQRLFQ